MGALRVSNLGKAYKRYPTKWSRAAEWLTGRSYHDEIWVLRDLSFNIEPGQAVGIVGENGAGKSTLLKIITGITRPNTGAIETRGRVAALLELGMGFHPDFTGRQNVFVAGQLLGLSTQEIAASMSAIEAFAEIGDYIDRPIRLYSSGMQVRLAFSIATAIRPDILIVDEALSVGDAYFQHKSFRRIRDFRAEGTTLLIVSHDRAAIQSLCDRAILLERGFIIRDGSPAEVMDFYNAIIAQQKNSTVNVTRLPDGRSQTTSGTGEATVESLFLLNEADEPVDFIHVGQQVRLKVEIGVHASIPEVTFGYMIKDRLGQPVFGTNTQYLGLDLGPFENGAKITLVFSFPANIGMGSYSVTTALHVGEHHLVRNYEWRDLVLMFNVINTAHRRFEGISWLPPEVEYQA